MKEKRKGPFVLCSFFGFEFCEDFNKEILFQNECPIKAEYVRSREKIYEYKNSIRHVVEKRLGILTLNKTKRFLLDFE